ncbi:MAG: serine/threonine protein kinase [Planctomycetes bacterium]|nr:serine/threonine protein kinase [Planctomycetota bacterium]
MISAQDEQLLTTAHGQGLISKDQEEKVRAIIVRLSRMGIQKAASDVLVEKGYTTSVQLSLLGSERQRKGVAIPGYKVLGKLGEGAMGVVYKARSTTTDKIVAIKVLGKKHSRDPRSLSRFLRESKLTLKLSHPNIVGGVEANSAQGVNYFVMEFIDGESVSDLLEREGVIPEALALEIVLQVASALSHAGAAGLIHRDIKPDNVMIDVQGVAKLCDLGLAKDDSCAAGLTQSGTTVGTPHYISPEQARGRSDLDTRTDIYSLGATLYHMVTGQTPFPDDNPTVVMTKHLGEQPIDPLQLTPGLSRSTGQLIAWMMEKEREKRIQNPKKLIEAATLAKEGKPVRPPTKGVKAVREKKADISTPSANKVVGASAPSKKKKTTPRSAGRSAGKRVSVRALAIAAGSIAAILLIAVTLPFIFSTTGAGGTTSSGSNPNLVTPSAGVLSADTPTIFAVGETPLVSSEETAAQRLEAEAQRALREALSWFDGNKTSYVEARSKFIEVAGKYSGTRGGADAQIEADRVYQLASNEARVVWNRMELEWRDLPDYRERPWNSYFIELDDFEKKFHFLSTFVRNVREKQEQIRGYVSEETADVLFEAQVLASDYKFDEAIEVIDEALDDTLPEFVGALERKREEIIGRSEIANVSRDSTVYRVFWATVEDILITGDFRRALDFTKWIHSDERSISIRAFVEDDIAIVETLLGCTDLVVLKLRTIIEERTPIERDGRREHLIEIMPTNQELKYGGFDHQILVRGAEEGAIFQGRRSFERLSRIQPDEFALLCEEGAKISSEPKAKKALIVAMALVYLEGKPDRFRRAVEYLDDASAIWDVSKIRATAMERWAKELFAKLLADDSLSLDQITEIATILTGELSDTDYMRSDYETRRQVIQRRLETARIANLDQSAGAETEQTEGRSEPPGRRPSRLGRPSRQGAEEEPEEAPDPDSGANPENSGSGRSAPAQPAPAQQGQADPGAIAPAEPAAPQTNAGENFRRGLTRTWVSAVLLQLQATPQQRREIMSSLDTYLDSQEEIMKLPEPEKTEKLTMLLDQWDDFLIETLHQDQLRKLCEIDPEGFGARHPECK